MVLSYTDILVGASCITDLFETCIPFMGIFYCIDGMVNWLVLYFYKIQAQKFICAFLSTDTNIFMGYLTGKLYSELDRINGIR